MFDLVEVDSNDLMRTTMAPLSDEFTCLPFDRELAETILDSGSEYYQDGDLSLVRARVAEAQTIKDLIDATSDGLGGRQILVRLISAKMEEVSDGLIKNGLILSPEQTLTEKERTFGEAEVKDAFEISFTDYNGNLVCVLKQRFKTYFKDRFSATDVFAENSQGKGLYLPVEDIRPKNGKPYKVVLSAFGMQDGDRQLSYMRKADRITDEELDGRVWSGTTHKFSNSSNTEFTHYPLRDLAILPSSGFSGLKDHEAKLTELGTRLRNDIKAAMDYIREGPQASNDVTNKTDRVREFFRDKAEISHIFGSFVDLPVQVYQTPHRRTTPSIPGPMTVILATDLYGDALKRACAGIIRISQNPDTEVIPIHFVPTEEEGEEEFSAFLAEYKKENPETDAIVMPAFKKGGQKIGNSRYVLSYDRLRIICAAQKFNFQGLDAFKMNEDNEKFGAVSQMFYPRQGHVQQGMGVKSGMIAPRYPNNPLFELSIGIDVSRQSRRGVCAAGIGMFAGGAVADISGSLDANEKREDEELANLIIGVIRKSPIRQGKVLIIRDGRLFEDPEKIVTMVKSAFPDIHLTFASVLKARSPVSLDSDYGTAAVHVDDNGTIFFGVDARLVTMLKKDGSGPNKPGSMRGPVNMSVVEDTYGLVDSPQDLGRFLIELCTVNPCSAGPVISIPAPQYMADRTSNFVLTELINGEKTRDLLNKGKARGMFDGPLSEADEKYGSPKKGNAAEDIILLVRRFIDEHPQGWAISV
ncbi:hypothetical protein [Sulfitobacter sp. R18_1]|uniref:hypothetical protein n=1 Tax=Sulfitobacter sp. R18_1 TaxID=2821104 RepID=UPI001ADD335A|nr:hypothetical protein [Sulfitobacter sp. R18_1]MBO9428076.1 hypothetical protein [Sulfitobacter sp. R18_1]